MSLKDTQISPKTAGIAIGAGLLVIAAAATLIVKSQSSAPAIATTGGAVVRLTKTTASGDTPQRTTVLVTDKSGDPMKLIAERNIFKPVVQTDDTQAQPAQPVQPTALPTMPVNTTGMMGFGMGMGSAMGGGNSSKKLAFTGVVETPDGTKALIENVSSSETRLVAQGETAFGMEVQEIGSERVSLMDYSTGSSMTLTLGENKPDTTTAASAGGGNQQQQQQMQGWGNWGNWGRRNNNRNNNNNQSGNNTNNGNTGSNQTQGNAQGGSQGGFSGGPGGGPGGFGGPPPGM